MEVLHDMLDQIERQRLSKMLSEMPNDGALTDARFVQINNLVMLYGYDWPTAVGLDRVFFVKPRFRYW